MDVSFCKLFQALHRAGDGGNRLPREVAVLEVLIGLVRPDLTVDDVIRDGDQKLQLQQHQRLVEAVLHRQLRRHAQGMRIIEDEDSRLSVISLPPVGHVDGRSGAREDATVLATASGTSGSIGARGPRRSLTAGGDRAWRATRHPRRLVMHWALSGQTLQAPAGACRNHLRLIEPIRVMRSRCSSQRRSASSNSSSVGGFFFSCVVSDVLSDVG